MCSGQLSESYFRPFSNISYLVAKSILFLYIGCFRNSNTRGMRTITLFIELFIQILFQNKTQLNKNRFLSSIFKIFQNHKHHINYSEKTVFFIVSCFDTFHIFVMCTQMAHSIYCFFLFSIVFQFLSTFFFRRHFLIISLNK